MHTIGLVGGMSWHSTADYYRGINETVARELGGHASAQLVLRSLDFAEIRECQVSGDWDRAAALLTEAALACQSAGAEAVAICTNLMHRVAPQVEAALDVPLVHIADAVAAEAVPIGATRLGVLGARWVMEESFYADRLADHGCSAVVPGEQDRTVVDRVIFEELTQGRVEPESRAAYVAVIEDLAARGAEAVVLACTEIGMLVGPEDSPLPLIDSCAAHSRMLARLVLEGV